MIRSIHILVYTVVFTLLLAILFGVHTASAQSAAQSSVQGPTQADDRSWQLAIALGQGQRSNPLVGGENIDINYVIDFSWYGERFFFDNGDLGYTLWGTHNLSINTLVTLNNERNYYNYLTGQQFGLDSIIDNGFGMISGGSIASGLPDTGIKPAGDDHNSAEAIDRNQRTELAARDAALNGGFEIFNSGDWNLLAYGTNQIDGWWSWSDALNMTQTKH